MTTSLFKAVIVALSVASCGFEPSASTGTSEDELSREEQNDEATTAKFEALQSQIEEVETRVSALEKVKNDQVRGAATLSEAASERQAKLIGLPGGSEQEFDTMESCLNAKAQIEGQRTRPGFVPSPLGCMEL